MSGEVIARETDRQYDVVDQLLSMHSVLRDRYARRALVLNTSLVGVSLFLCVLAFVDHDVLRTVGVDPATSRVVLGLCGLVLLLLSITEFRVNWTHVASQHALAVGHLADLKAKFRTTSSDKASMGSQTCAMLTEAYHNTMRILPSIPDHEFNRLKAYHQFKRLLSSRISENPKAPNWLLHLQLRLEGICDALRTLRT